ncbi:MAG: undecaprenyl-diphosphate phosphatase [Bacteroidales bacterium]|nr:undecaprenyl-diphosphate phosphatase [Bacteroidales bacterium]MCB9028070.1 undecaprenyl-diphosphate phosphatase [Bacteroidales bacterium]NLD63128.1 undecaprenyl-diphosphate phosphatase [Bacteroidales bacterium]HOO66035.1 undecaprenyl-diphosphate phosphatase [Bacteroidales bacterium]HPE22154.1 undecaprenyl-diphosphate phosphatase [Bacteroidales bacterium]
MNWYEALIFGLVQGLTEFLPVSSDGHLEIVKYLFGGIEESFLFSVVVHGATVLSILVVFWKEIVKLMKGVFRFTMNEEMVYALKIIVSMIPVAIVGFTMRDKVEALFVADMDITGSFLLVTALFLLVGHFVPKRDKPVTYGGAFLMGIAQALAVLPGVSRSGSTISTGLMLGNSKNELARFSFLMVIVPIMGANFMQVISTEPQAVNGVLFPLIIAFVAAFVSGYAACRWMINIVRKGKLGWFALYCILVGLTLIIFA